MGRRLQGLQLLEVRVRCSVPNGMRERGGGQP